MPNYSNGTNIGAVYANGTAMTKMYANGVEVWTSVSMIWSFISEQSSQVIGDFNTSGDASGWIGAQSDLTAYEDPNGLNEGEIGVYFSYETETWFVFESMEE